MPTNKPIRVNGELKEPIRKVKLPLSVDWEEIVRGKQAGVEEKPK